MNGCQTWGRAKGSMCSFTAPSWKMRRVPDDWLTQNATAFEWRLTPAAAKCRLPNPFESSTPSVGTFR